MEEKKMNRFINFFPTPKELTPLQKEMIIKRLEEIESIYFLLNDPMRQTYQTVINGIRSASNLTRTKLLDIKGICPSVYYEIDLVIKGKPSLKIDILTDSPEFQEIKKHIKSIVHLI
jgi:hypothetical protein